VRYPVIIDDKLNEIILTNIYYIPAIDYNLLLITTLERKRYSTAIVNSPFNIIDNLDNEKILSGTRVGTSYLLDLKYSKTLYTLKSSYRLSISYSL